MLITVKAAPNPSSTYGETVCVAGISTDLADPGWVRLYPINFRELGSDAQFQKYDLIEVDGTPAVGDPRSESWRPIMTTMTRSVHLPPWAKRRPLVDPYIEPSMCKINSGSLLPAARSLAAIQVADVSDFVVTPHPGWSKAEHVKIDRYVNQLDLFGTNDRTALEAPRFRGKYHWRCSDRACRGHEQGLLDWEFVALQRNLHDRPDDETQALLRHRFLEEICGPGKDLAFYVGNQAKRHNVFSVLGVYYPKAR
ncbi:hypothetical protein [uncultured Jatrophihabitans sp.]|uniref:hypothetical protein n=1 Tax=uncultured Jatrophihabitans sp. TaxID=1610747 RepID=UPI0035CBEA09